MGKDWKKPRAREFIDEPTETLRLRLSEAQRLADYIREYNRELFKGRAGQIESPLGFTLNRIDDLNYSLTKKKRGDTNAQ